MINLTIKQAVIIIDIILLTEHTNSKTVKNITKCCPLRQHLSDQFECNDFDNSLLMFQKEFYETELTTRSEYIITEST